MIEAVASQQWAALVRAYRKLQGGKCGAVHGGLQKLHTETSVASRMLGNWTAAKMCFAVHFQ